MSFPLRMCVCVWLCVCSASWVEPHMKPFLPFNWSNTALQLLTSATVSVWGAFERRHDMCCVLSHTAVGWVLLSFISFFSPFFCRAKRARKLQVGSYTTTPGDFLFYFLLLIFFPLTHSSTDKVKRERSCVCVFQSWSHQWLCDSSSSLSFFIPSLLFCLLSLFFSFLPSFSSVFFTTTEGKALEHFFCRRWKELLECK